MLYTLITAIPPSTSINACIADNVLLYALPEQLWSRKGAFGYNWVASLAVILNLLEQKVFYTRYHAIQLVNTLLANCPARMQECVLAAPMGTPKLMDLLGDTSDVVRNGWCVCCCCRHCSSAFASV